MTKTVTVSGIWAEHVKTYDVTLVVPVPDDLLEENGVANPFVIQQLLGGVYDALVREVLGAGFDAYQARYGKCILGWLGAQV